MARKSRGFLRFFPGHAMNFARAHGSIPITWYIHLRKSFKVKDRNAHGTTWTVSSSDASVVTVTPVGSDYLLTAVAPGSCNISLSTNSGPLMNFLIQVNVVA